MKFITGAADSSVTIDNGKGSIAKLEEDIITVNNKEFTVKLNGDKISFKNKTNKVYFRFWIQRRRILSL
jgi:intein/homing endonuclease